MGSRSIPDNLNEEAAFIAQEDPASAQLVVKRIRTAVVHLARNPALGLPGRIPGTRELVVSGTRYIIPYRVNPRLSRIEILRKFHATRKLPQSRLPATHSSPGNRLRGG